MVQYNSIAAEWLMAADGTPAEGKFKALIGALARAIGDRGIDPDLEAWLNQDYAPHGSRLRP
jgi:hypothetical protein